MRMGWSTCISEEKGRVDKMGCRGIIWCHSEVVHCGDECRSDSSSGIKRACFIRAINVCLAQEVLF